MSVFFKLSNVSFRFRLQLVGFFLLFLVCGFLLSACDNQNKASAELDRPLVKIGVILPLSGNLAEFGQISKGAVEVAAKHIQHQRTRNIYQFIYEDNAYQALRTRTALMKLIDLDGVDAIIDIGSPGNVISPIAEQNKVIRMNALSSESNIAKGKYNFINWTQPQAEAEKMLSVVQGKPYKNVAIYVTNDSGTQKLALTLSTVLTENSVKNSVTMINPGTKDLKPEIYQSVADNADLYVILMHSPEIYVFMKQFQEIGVKADISSIETFTFFADLSPFEGILYVDAAEGRGKIIEEIKQHNKNSNVFGAANTYDNVMLLFEAFERAESKETAIEELLKIKTYDGAAGRLTQDENGIFHSQAIIKKVINGKAVIVKE